MEFNFQLFVQYLIIGLANGSLIALIALGYTLVYGIVEIINFAHGEVFMMGSFLAVTVIGWTAVTSNSTWLAIIAVAILGMFCAMAFSAAVNWGIDRVAYRRLRNAPRLAPLIAAIGFSFILQNIGIYWHGPANVPAPQLIATKFQRYNILVEWFNLDTKIRVRPVDLIVLVLTIPLLILLTYMIRSTKIGKAMRATAQDREAAALMGIDINRTISTAFLIGGALAGAAGMISLYYNNYTKFDIGFQFGLFAFTAAVLGGIGNLNGAVLGGFLIGLTRSMSDGFMKQYIEGWGSQWTTSVIFAVLVIIMIFRPTGLLGESTVEKV